jgi:ankyrin repeat protein
VLKSLLNLKGANINQPNQIGLTPFHLACKNISNIPFDVFHILVEKMGADFTLLTRNDNDTPLHLVFGSFKTNNDVNILKYLLTKSGMNVNQTNQKGLSLLHIACKSISYIPLSIFKQLINDFKHDENQYHPVYDAIQCFKYDSDVNVLTLLLKNIKIDINTPLKNTNLTMMDYLCSNINNIPLSIYHILFQNIDPNATHTPQKAPPINSAFTNFISNQGDPNVLLYLLTQKSIFDPDHIDFAGKTLLHYACSNIANLPFVIFKALIEQYNCNFVIKDQDDNIPINIAVMMVNIPLNDEAMNIITYLIHKLEYNGNIHDRNSTGKTLLHLVCEKVQFFPLHIFQHLIEKLSFNLKTKNNFGASPLESAFSVSTPHSRDIIPILTYLITMQAKMEKMVSDFNNKYTNTTSNYFESTILLSATFYISRLPIEIFKHIIEVTGIQINTSRDEDNRTPLHDAIVYFRAGADPNILTYLCSQQDVNAREKDPLGQTLLHLACIHINSSPIQLFNVLIENLGVDTNALDNYNTPPLSELLHNYSGANIESVLYVLHQHGITFNNAQGNDDNNNGNNTNNDQPRDYQSKCLHKLQEYINNVFKMTEYILNHKMIKDGIDAMKFLVWLCRQHNPNVKAIQLLCNTINFIDYDFRLKFGYNHLHALLYPRLDDKDYSRDNDDDNNGGDGDDGDDGASKIRLDSALSPLIEYFIEEKVERLLDQLLSQ